MKVMEESRRIALQKEKDYKKARNSSGKRQESRVVRLSSSLKKPFLNFSVGTNDGGSEKSQLGNESFFQLKEGEDMAQYTEIEQKYQTLNFDQFYKVNKEFGELGEGAESVVRKCTRLQKDNQ